MSEVFSNKLSLGLSAGLFTLACLIISLDLFQLPDNWLADRQLKLYAKQLNPANDIVVIDIDDESIEKISMFAGFWPWPRSVHAELIAGISPHHPKAIVFDILFSEADKFRPDSDSYFNEVIAEHRNIYFSLLHLTSSEHNTGELIKNQPTSAGITATAIAKENARAHLLLPKAIAPQHWLTGSINFTPDSDGVGRRYDIYRDIQGWRIPSLPAKVASDLGATLPDQASIILQWKRYKNSTLTTYSYADIYQAILENNQLLLSQLANKIIIIGSTASGLHDIRETPVSHQHPAVYILATAIDNLLRGQFLSPAHPVINWLLSLMIIGLISAAFLSQLNFKSQLLLAGVIITTTSSALLLSSYLVLRYGIQAKVATPITLGIISYIFFALLHGLQEHFERRQAITLFSRFVDPKVVSKLIKDKTLDIEKSSQQATLTLLFSDIRGFTSLSEQRSAAQIVSLLNDYFARQLHIIFKHKGTLDKFIGDCIMAFWGAPVSNTHQALDAVNAALAMADELLVFRKTLPKELQSFDVGIGIHTGPAVVGMIGAQQRVDYTAIGDTVNLASRIEGLTKDKARILVSEETKAACELSIKALASNESSSQQAAIEFIYCGQFQVKGREQAVKLYEPKRK